MILILVVGVVALIVLILFAIWLGRGNAREKGKWDR